MIPNSWGLRATNAPQPGSGLNISNSAHVVVDTYLLMASPGEYRGH